MTLSETRFEPKQSIQGGFVSADYETSQDYIVSNIFKPDSMGDVDLFNTYLASEPDVMEAVDICDTSLVLEPDLMENVDLFNTIYTKKMEPKSINVIRPDVWSAPKYCFNVLQKFEGTVLEISESECLARVRDLTSPEYNVEEITFSIEEISKSDLFLAKPGAIFYWSIGYEDTLGGQRRRLSVIRFQRIPVWKKKELDHAQREAESLGKLLGWKTTQKEIKLSK